MSGKSPPTPPPGAPPGAPPGRIARNGDAQPGDYVARLRRLRVRVTPQRLLVLEALAANGGHMTADAILQWAVERYPALNLATVYRTLDLLISLGLVAQTDLGSGVTHFELVGESPHHHLVCERCGAVGEMDAVLFVPLQQRLLERYGFRSNPRHVALFGLCRECVAQSEAQRGVAAPEMEPVEEHHASADDIEA
jgi:Fur family ferric uptake transcriptional regulator